jgi:hypothetical protein
MGDVNNFAANNMVNLDEIKDKFTSEENRLGIFNDCL